jgi:hypothetical protein
MLLQVNKKLDSEIFTKFLQPPRLSFYRWKEKKCSSHNVLTQWGLGSTFYFYFLVILVGVSFFHTLKSMAQDIKPKNLLNFQQII